MSNVDDRNGSTDRGEDSPAPSGRGDFLMKAAIDRRTMLKAAVATGTIAATWVAPRIETLGFAPAAAAGTPCIILSPSSDDKNSNSGGHDCVTPTPSPSTKGFVHACCGQSFGDAGKADIFTFTNPAPNCQQIVVRTITLDCNTSNKNPDVGQFAVVIDSVTDAAGHPGACTTACHVMDAVLVASSGRAILKNLNNGPVACPPAGGVGDGVDASLSCTDPLLTSSSRLAVRLACIGGTVGCTPP